MLDYIGHSDMIVGANAALDSDRFKNPKSALYLNSGYCTVPPGVYFNGSFTITAWVKKVQTTNQNRLLDFGNGRIENVIFSITSSTNSKPYLAIGQTIGWSGPLASSSALGSGVWTHLASVFNGSNAYIYLNGTLTMSESGITVHPDNIVRQDCFIGRSSWYPGDQDANAYFDDIKIYNRALSSQEIVQDMN
jgi:hypothetical protein